MLIRCSEIFKSFNSGRRKIEVLRGCSLSINEATTVVLFGESGCGKTTLGRILLGLIKPDRGRVFFRDVEITSQSKLPQEMRRKLQLIPQNPAEALDPRWKIYDSIAEPLRIHGLTENREEEMNAVMEICERVGLKDEQISRRPAELSGGELQRVAIARAMIMRPEFVVCDEPTSMLDVSIQAAVVRMLTEMQREFGVSYLFITHDIDLAKVIADKMYIMQNGRIIRELKGEELQELSPGSSILCEQSATSTHL
ncbi:ABC transporter ATP-binding protein [Archaeoglobus neptunius]|uniref:ABC transporter ATP-binding protein n=1 Tax=Archaeoglobus neptunius TaxID=2798580 RepID=UPI0019269420|nr:dipeptide/oligopeptide/nickel ABC transporter ATP-binding protein [Archaeoglobus neptunius]